MSIANILQTERTIVTRITLQDAPFFVRLLNTPEWKRYVGDRDVKNVEEAEEYLANGLIAAYEMHGFSYYLVRLRDSTPIGICGFLKKPHLDNPDFGYALLPEFHGRGLAWESSQAILEYGIDAFQLTTIDAEVQPDNARSIMLLDRLGFKHTDQVVSSGDEELLLYRFEGASSR